MPRPKRYVSDAEKMKAYRERKRGFVEKEPEVQTKDLGDKDVGLRDTDVGGMLCPECSGHEIHNENCSQKNLPVDNYGTKNHRNLPEVPESKNTQGQAEQERGASLSTMREQEDIRHKTQERILDQNEAGSKATGESGSGHGDSTRKDQEADDMSKVRDRVSIDTHSRTPPRLREKTGSDVAMPSMPHERTLNTNVTLPALSKTDQKFDEDRPGWYIFGKEVKEEKCWTCGKPFRTQLEMNRFCSPKCKNEYLAKISPRHEIPV